MALKPLVLLPPLVFAALAGLFGWAMLTDDGSGPPSALVGRPAPAVPAEGLPGYPVLSDADLRGSGVTIVNFWASWCPPCRAEHPVLTDLGAQGYRVVGMNFRDLSEDAVEFLAQEGNPFAAIGFDPTGRNSIDWGVTAPPESFIVADDGTVLFRYAGPLLGDDFEQRFLPALAAATNPGG